MNYIPLLATAPLLGWIALGVTLAISATLAVLTLKEKVDFGWFPTAVLILIVGGAFGAVMVAPNSSNQLTEVGKVIEANYGLELDEAQLNALKYPVEEPTVDSRTYGAIDHMLPGEDGSYELNRIFLIWKDGEMKLAKSTDGESFSELKAHS